MAGQQELDDGPAGFQNPRGMGLQIHAGGDNRDAGREENIPAFIFHQANPAGPGPGKAGMKTEGGDGDGLFPGQFEDGRVRQAADNISIDGQGDGFQWRSLSVNPLQGVLDG